MIVFLVETQRLSVVFNRVEVEPFQRLNVNLLDSWYSDLRFESLAFTRPNIPPIIVDSHSHITCTN